jgi:hypothetical protein
MSLTPNLYLVKINNFFTSSFNGSLVLAVCSKISWSSQFLSNLTKGCKCSWHFTNIGYKDFLSYSSTRSTPCSLPTNEDIIQTLLNLGSNIKKSYYELSYFHIFSRMKGKNLTQ